MDVQKTTVRLSHGDVVVLLSDGIADNLTQEGEESLFLESVLCDVTDNSSLANAAEAIAETSPGKNDTTDDRSVILLRIE